MERPRHAMNASENNCYAGANKKEGTRAFITIKCGHVEGRRLAESSAFGHVCEGFEENVQWMEDQCIYNTKQSPMFFLFSLNESEELLHLGEIGSRVCGEI